MMVSSAAFAAGQPMPTDTTGPARDSVQPGTGCGVNKDQHCPIELMPPDFNRDDIIKAMMASPAPTGTIDDIINADRAVPTEWKGPTDPVPLPQGKKKIVAIPCSAALAGCVVPMQGIQEAAQKFGWDFNMYDGKGDAETISKYMLSAVATHADLIVVAGLDPLPLQQGMQAASDAGIPVISITSALDTPSPVVKAPAGAFWPLIDISADFVRSGRMMADWAIWDSKGKGGIIILDGKESTSQVSMAAAVDEINKVCPDCKTYSTTLLGNEVGTVFPQKAVAFLRAHPDAKYVIFPYDPAASALVPALQQAGMTDVKLVSMLGIAENLQFIRDGQSQTADVSWDNKYSGWAALDQWFRYLAKQPFVEPHGEGIPQLLLDATNVGTNPDNWTTQIDYRSKYLKLWGVQ
jgi:ribose transport system substrate-binding protein